MLVSFPTTRYILQITNYKVSNSISCFRYSHAQFSMTWKVAHAMNSEARYLYF